MKFAQAQEMIMNGDNVLIATFLVSVPEVIKFTDKESGKAREFPALKHRVMNSKDVVTLVERVDANFNAGAYVSPFQTGQKVVAVFETAERKFGNANYRVKRIEALEDAPAVTGLSSTKK